MRAAKDLARLPDLIAADVRGNELRRLVHNIAGAAGTFGFAGLGEAAVAIDDDYARDERPSPEAFERLMQALQDVAKD